MLVSLFSLRTQLAWANSSTSICVFANVKNYQNTQNYNKYVNGTSEKNNFNQF